MHVNGFSDTLPHRAVCRERIRFYLLADEDNELKTFRVDRMDNVNPANSKPTLQSSNETCSVEIPESEETIKEESLEELVASLDLLLENPTRRKKQTSIDASSYMKSTFGMYHGEKEKVTMLFTKEMMDVVIDKFEEIDVEIVDDEHFRIKVDVAVSPQFFTWIFGLGENVMIEYPLKVAKQMKDMLKERHKAYREAHSRNIYYY